MKVLFSSLLLFCIVGLSQEVKAQLATGPRPTFKFLKTQGVYEMDGILGRIQFKSFIYGIEREHAAIRAIMTSAPNGAAIPTDLVFYTGPETVAERFRVTSRGLLGVNNPNPMALLSIAQYEDGLITDNLFQIVTGNPDSVTRFTISRLDPYRLRASLKGNVHISDGHIAVNTDYVPEGYVGAFNGPIIATKFIIDRYSRWPDYVFGPNYKRLSLCEVEAYIEEHGHLPGVPSAEEIANSGFSLGDMQAISMEKIEEIFLHLIDEKAAVEEELLELRGEFEKLTKRMDEFENMAD